MTVAGFSEDSINSFMRVLQAQGLSTAAAAGVLANYAAESSLNPKATNASGHTGLAQWDRDRWGKYRQWLVVNPRNWAAGFVSGAEDPYLTENQIRWTIAEMKTRKHGPTDEYDQLLKQGDPAKAASYFNQYYEQSGDSSGRRGDLAKQFYDTYVQTGGKVSDGKQENPLAQVASDATDKVASAVSDAMFALWSDTAPFLVKLGCAGVGAVLIVSGVKSFGRPR